MAISYINSSQAFDTAWWTSDVNLNIAKPTNTAEDDVMVCWGMKGSLSGDVTLPSGWTELDHIATTSNKDVFLGWKLAGASEPSTYDFVSDAVGSGTDGLVFISTFRGIDTASPLDVTYAQGSHFLDDTDADSSPASPTITIATTGAATIATVLTTSNGSTASFTDPSGYSSDANLSYEIGAFAINGAGAYKLGLSTGVETPGDWGITITEDSHLWIVALKPAASGPITIEVLPGGTPY